MVTYDEAFELNHVNCKSTLEPAVTDKIALHAIGDGTYADNFGRTYQRNSAGKMVRLRNPEPVEVDENGDPVPKQQNKNLVKPIPKRLPPTPPVSRVEFGEDAMKLDKGRFVIPIPKKFAPYIKSRIATTGRIGRQVYIRFPNGHGASIVNTTQSSGVELKPVTWNHHLTKHDELKSFSYFSDKWDGYEQIQIMVGGQRVRFGSVIGNASKEEIAMALEIIEALPVMLEGEDYAGTGKSGTFKIERYLLAP